MLTFAVQLTCNPSPGAITPRTLEVASMFGLGVDGAQRQGITVIPPTDIPVPAPGPGVMLITGPSGSGKSSLLRLIIDHARQRGLRVVGDAPRAFDQPHRHGATAAPSATDDRAVIDRVAPDRPLHEALRMCALAGLSDAFALLRRPCELSDGQRFRLRLAQAMAEAIEAADAPSRPLIVIDEFAATLDRITARALAGNVRRWTDRTGVTFVLATTHDDLLDALDPEVFIYKGLGGSIEVSRRPRGLHDSGLARARGAGDGDRPGGALAGDFDIESGTLADFRLLAGFHYRSRHAAAATSVLRVNHRRSTVAGEQTCVVGVLVRSMPALACALRDVATAGRYGRHLSQREQASLLNREVRCISRVVVDPRFRGLGLATALVRHALSHPETPRMVFTEALAAMGRVSPFFERAGMTRFDRPQRDRPGHARLLDALEHAGIEPFHLADTGAVLQRVSAMTPAERALLMREFRRFLRAAGRVNAATLNAMSERDLVIAARERLLLQPVYYLFAH